MSLSANTQQQLQTLMQQDPALVAKVHGTNDATQAAALIAEAAAQNGIEVSAAALAAHFEESSKASANQALSDEQLEAVAGGAGVVDAIFMSIFTLGIGCVVVSVQTSNENVKNGKPWVCNFG